MSQLVRLLLICLTMLILPLQGQAASASAHAHAHTQVAPQPGAHAVQQAQHTAAMQAQDRSACSSVSGAHCHDDSQAAGDHQCGGAHCSLCAALPPLGFAVPLVDLHTEQVMAPLAASDTPPLDSLERPPQSILA